MENALKDQQAINSGQITRDQLSPERQANLAKVEAMAASDPNIAQRAQNQVDLMRKAQTDTNELVKKINDDRNTCVMSVCVSNLGAKAWGAVAIAGEAGSAAAAVGKNSSNLAVQVASRTYEASRGATEAVMGMYDSGSKVLTAMQSPPGAAPESGVLRAGMAGNEHLSAPPGAEGGGGGRGESGGHGESAGLETAIDGSKVVTKTGDAISSGSKLVDTYRTARDADQARAENRTYQPGSPEPEAGVSTGERIQSGTKAVSEGLETYKNGREAFEAYQKNDESWKSKAYGTGVGGVKTAAEIAKMLNKKELGEDLEHLGGYAENAGKMVQSDRPLQGAGYGIEASGEALKLVNKDYGSAVAHTGKMVRYIDDYRSVYETETQVQRSEQMIARNNQTLEERIRAREQFIAYYQLYCQTHTCQ